MSLKDCITVTKIILKMNISNISPFHIGAGNDEVIIDEESSELCIPGTTIAGAFKGYLSERVEAKLVNELFGQNNKQSKIFIYDSFAKMIDMEIRSGIGVDPQLGSVENGKLFERDYVGKADEFQIEIEINICAEDEINEYKKMLYSCIDAIKSGDITFGAYKNIGLGNFRVNSVEEVVIHMENKEQLFNYLAGDICFRDISLDIKNYDFVEGNDITFELKGYLKTPLLIKGEEAMDKNLPDGEPVRNVKGEYIIPGSSLKGVIRAQGDRILNYYNISYISEQIFGAKGEQKEKVASNLKTFDSIITEDCGSIYNRIKIDKFTAGVANGAVMNDKAILGNVTLRAKLKNANLEQKIKNIGIAVVALVFRDIALGDLSLGSGYNIGRGRINANVLTVYKGKEKIYEYDFLESVMKIDNMKLYFDSLKEGVH